MSISETVGAVDAMPGQTIDVSSLFSISSANNPTYLIVSLLDRSEYTAASNGDTGTLSGNGATASFASIGGDADTIGLVFTWNAATGQYTNATFGNLADLTYTASTNINDNTSFSLFGTNSLANADTYASNPFVLAANPDYFSYGGSVSIVTEPSLDSQTPAQATPDSVCSAALSFVGDAWNMDGCWVLASDIAAEAGASLPLTSTELFVPGQDNGEWIVAFDGPAGQTGNWQAMVHAGEIVAFATSSSSGHITTVVSGAGSTAELVDNITYITESGSIVNSANDGSANDIVISAPHLASQEWAQAVPGTVVIYELDTPVITDSASTIDLDANSSDQLSSMFTAADPAGRAITEYQFYDTGSHGAAVANSFSVGGADETASSAAGAITVNASSLSSADFLSGAAAAGDTLDIRAFNGLYWGDWQTETIDVAAPSAPPAVSASGNTTINQAAASGSPDFYGDGTSDVLWQNTNGAVVEWQMNGSTIASSATIADVAPGSGWSIAGNGDFTGNGDSDILWQNTNGAVDEWDMNGSTMVSSATIADVAPGSGWSIAGVGDFTGDGTSDILWQNTNGTVAEWQMNGSTIASSATIADVAPGSGWSIAGIGDFTGNGDSDILWKNTNGTVAEWQMNGNTVASSATIADVAPGSGWSIAGIGDFNGDGMSDILWQNTNGTVAVWDMNGSTIASSATIADVAPGSGWSIAGIGDYNGDGTSDILWQNVNGTVATWLINGNAISSSPTVASVSPSSGLSIEESPTSLAVHA